MSPKKIKKGAVAFCNALAQDVITGSMAKDMTRIVVKKKLFPNFLEKKLPSHQVVTAVTPVKSYSDGCHLGQVV